MILHNEYANKKIRIKTTDDIRGLIFTRNASIGLTCESKLDMLTYEPIIRQLHEQGVKAIKLNLI